MKTIAIYSRKSKFTGKGDSIENQIEMCRDYINRILGKDNEILIYEDEGFSGSTMNRPKFKRLIQDIKKGKIDILICYRLDRISRTVADFSSTLELLQENNCSFVSIKEQFDTSSPMGRAMIYIASVFAQLERETIAERVKDNMYELAKCGRWTGGKIPLGFTSERVKYLDENGLQREYSLLNRNDEEMKFIKLLYEKYLELGSLHKLEGWITENQLRSRNGIMFEKSTLKIILQNPIYVKSSCEVVEYLRANNWSVYGDYDNIHSLLTYNKTEQTIKNGKRTKILKPITERFAAISKIEGELEPNLWLRVQEQFDENRNKFPRLGKTHNVLLVGKVRCGHCKEYMLVQHGKTSKSGEKLFYYMCSLKRKSHKKLCDNGNAKSNYIEDLVIKSLKLLSTSKKGFIDNLKKKLNTEIKDNKNSIEKFSLEKTLDEKKKQIDNLIVMLSKGEGIEDLFLDKIKELKNDCKKIELSMLNLENSQKKTKSEALNLELIESLLNSCSVIDTLSRDEQKLIIDTLIDTIYYYGDGYGGKGKIEIKFIGTDEDVEEIDLSQEDLDSSMLHFNSHSTRQAYDNLLSYRKTQKNQRS